MSSAILYVAIVAIWAGVLIPRWLRRDSPSGEQVSDDSTSPTFVTDGPDTEEQAEPPRPREDEAPRTRRTDRPGPVEARPARRQTARPEAGGPEAGGPEAGRPEASRDASDDQEHARVLSARRRLLGLLLVLIIGSGALAVTQLAAWWVVVPPSVMLLGYLALLREASKADAERRERARTAAVTRVPAPVAPAAPPAPAPDAEIIEISPAQGPTVLADEEFYDQYADAKLRAVGDLARV